MGAGLGLTQLIAFGTSLYLLTILSEPIRVSTGWGLPWITGGLSIGVLAGSVISPLVGRRIGRGQAREVLSLSSLCFAAGLTIIGLSSGLPIFMAGWILVGLGMKAPSVFGRPASEIHHNPVSLELADRQTRSASLGLSQSLRPL